jgi:ABC-type sugar transport system ATPase subunit
LLSLQNVGKSINGRYIVRNIQLEVPAMKRLAIAGATGSGKSTLLKLIVGWEHADEGKIYFRGKRVMGPNYQLVPGEPGIAYLSQHYELRNHYRMEELLSYANTLSDEAAMDIYKLCRIDHLLQRNTFQLSGGEKQRIALARLLVSAPKLLLLDEPYSNLDLIHKTLLKQVIHEIAQRLDITCILTSHDPLDTLSWADELMILKDGGVVQQGSPRQLYHHPENEYVAGLLGDYNKLDAGFLQQYFGVTISSDWAFIRPEQFAILTEYHPNSVAGTVTEIRFGGSYTDIILTVDGPQRLQIRIMSGRVSINEKIYVSLTLN